MPNGGKGAIAKIYVETEVVDNFKQQAAKIKSGLGNSLKDIKDLDLNFGFETESMAKAAGKELNEVMKLATSQKLERLDFSGIFPGLTDYLKDNSIADELKLQVVQGLRKGLEDFSRLSSTKDIENLMRGDGTDVWSNLLLSNATKDVIGSFDLKKKDNDIFLKQFKTLTSSNIRKDSGSFIQDLQQLLSLKATADNKEYQDVIKYLVSGRYYDARSKKEQLMFELPAINDALRINDFYKKGEQDKLTEKDIRNFAGYFGRLQYLTTVSDDEGLHEIYNGIIKNKHFDELFNPKNPKEGLAPDQLAIFREVVDQVIKASQYKDTQYQAMDKQAFKSDVSQAVNALFAASGDNGTIARLSPLIRGWEEKTVSVSADQLLAETIKSLGIRSEDNGLREENTDSAERAERAASRAEQAADRAETASETAVQAAEDIRQAVEDGTSQTDDKSNDKPQTQKASSTQSDNIAEHIADSAEADAENTEHIAETLEEKKERLENGLVEIRNKAKSLKDANKKYRKAIEETYDDIKTPEEALQLLKEKSAQLQQADSEFKGIESKRNSFTDPRNNEELAILEEYNQKRANLEQAIIEYNKAGRLAVDRKVNPEDIRQNLVDEERLSFDSRGDYIDHLKQVIADNEKDIKNWEDLITQYQSQLDQLNTGQIGQTGQQLNQQQNAIIEEINNIDKQISKFEKIKKELPKRHENQREFIDSLITQRSEINSTLKKKATPNNYQEALEDIKNNIEQLKESEKAFKEIETQFNALDKKDISVEAHQIRVEYEKRLADLQRAAYAYNRSKENAVQFKEYNEQDVQGLLNQAGYDTTKGFLGQNISTQQLHKALKQRVKELKENIPQRESWYKDSVKYDEIRYQRRIDGLIQQRNELEQKLPHDNLALDTGHEEVEQVQKTREELQAERERLAEEIQQSSQTMDEAEQQITSIDKNIKQTQQSERRNDATINKLLEEKEQIESQIRQTEDELKTIKERLQDAVDAKQSTEEEIRTLNEQFFNTDSLVVSADFPENSDRYNQLTDEKRSTDFDLKFNQEMLEQATQEQEALEKILKGSYSTKTLNDAYKQAMARKKEYIQLQKEFEKRPLASEKFGIEDIGSANYMLAVTEDQEARVKVDKAWMAYYKAFQEFESHGRNGSGNKEAMKERLLLGIDSHNLPVFTSFAAETVPAELEEELKTLNAEIEERKKEVEETQKKADELQQQIDELSSHIVTKDDILQKIQEKEKEQQKFEQEEDSWTTQQYNKQIELEDLNKQLNGTRGVTNHLKTTQEAQQNNKEELQRLQQQRDEQQRIYDEAKAIQEEKARQLEELDRLMAETGIRESASPATTREKPVASSESPLSSSGSQTADGVQEEGAEASDAATKMKALADAKKEALEANRQLAESADTTTNAIQNESNAENFDELISKLIEAAKLLGQLPQSFEGFKGFDLEPLNNLSQVIQQFPKEGFNISLGDSFDNLANNIDKTLQKVQELTSQAKNAEIESTIAEKYDEQIRQLKTDVEEAKRVIEELKKTKQDIQKTTPTTQSKKQETPVPVPVEPYFEDKIIGTNYKFLKETQQKLFDAKTVQDFQAALQDVESVLQRIQALENEAVQKHATPMDVLYMAHNGSMPSEYENKMPELAKGRLESSANLKSLTDNFVSEQQKMVDALQGKLDSIEIIPEEVQANWGDQQREQYNRMAEGVKFAQASVKELGNVLSELQSKGFDAEQMKWFLELKEATTGSVDNLENQNNAFNNSVSTKSGNYLSKLSGAEKRLQKIKDDSEKLIHIDPSLNDVLQQTEQHLKEIRKIKNTINKDPLQVLNPQFTNDTESYISQLYGTDDKQGALKDFEQVSDRSQTDFDRIISNYSRYTTALNKLFSDLAKGSSISADQLIKDLTRINDLASRLANGTGLNKNDLLTGELDSKADSTIVDAQTEATNKFAIAYEAMLTKIETNAESAKNRIEKIFGTEGITQGLDNNFIEGNAEGFNDFVQKANQIKKSLQDLEDIQDNIKNDKTWLLQENNLKEYQQTMSVLTNSLRQVSEKSSDFKIADKLDVQKLRASTAQFIKDNPALSGADIAELQGYISQLQDKINNIDFKNIEDGIRKVKQDATEAGRTGDTFFSMLTQRFKSLGTYLLSFASFYEVINVFKQGINIVHELDDALTEMQKVSDESLASLREYQKTTFATANEIGTTAAQLQQSTADWLRLGEDLQQASQSAQTANVLFNVSEFESIDEATTALVAMSAAYADVEKGIDKMDIVDRLNLIGNNYAIATDELATALQDGAATLQTAGNDLDEAIALTTAGNEKIA